MGASVLLVLDYPGRRAESRVADLRLAEAGFEVRDLLLPPFVRRLTGDDYAAELVDRHGPFGTEVAAVLAYCMAAPIAQEVAVRCGAGRDPVPLVLFDGEPSTIEAVAEQYGVSAAQVSGEAGAGDPVLPFDPALLSADPGASVELMRGRLVDLARRALDPDGVQADSAQLAGDVAEFYLDWLVHLVAAHNATWPRWGGEVAHVLSRTHTFAGDWPGARTTRHFRVDVERNGLLGHPRTREIVLSFLGTASGSPAEGVAARGRETRWA